MKPFNIGFRRLPRVAPKDGDEATKLADADTSPLSAQTVDYNIPTLAAKVLRANYAAPPDDVGGGATALSPRLARNTCA
jgi:hypothetical protein